MASRFLVLSFLALLAGVPLFQAGHELTQGQRIGALEVFGPLEEERLRAFEDGLRRDSLLQRFATPYYQWALTTLFGRGNEKAIAGSDGWLFYAPDFDVITGPDFRAPAAPEVAPLDAIVAFRDDLARRGVELLLVPVPTKPMVEPARVSALAAGLERCPGPWVPALLDSLRAAGVRLVDVEGVYAGLGSPRYLARDTHWTPGTMRAVARETSREVRALPGTELALDSVTYAAAPAQVAGPGDTTQMLNLPPGRVPWDPMQLMLEQVSSAGAAFAPDRDAPLLLLGDSFTQVFSDPELGLGAGAGFGEHLARELGAPLDVIAIAGGGARASREALARRGDGLAGKRLVIWELSLRDLAGPPGTWDPVELSAGAGTSGAPPEGGTLRVVAEIVEVSRVPEDFAYETCLLVYEYRVLEVLEGSHDGGPLWVAHLGFDDYAETELARLTVGTQHEMRVEPIERHYDLERTSWADDTDAGFEIGFAVELSAPGSAAGD